MPCETRNIVNAKLVHDLLPVFLDGFDADAQVSCNLFVGVTFGNELQHFGFARGE